MKVFLVAVIFLLCKIEDIYCQEDCPDNYEKGYDNSCFFFSDGAQTYQGARFDCLAVNDSDLVIINDGLKLNYLLNRTEELNSNGDGWWIGYFDRATEDQWTWADCQTSNTWQEALWATNEPTGIDEDCGVLERSGKLSDYVCDRGFRYICEISPKGFSRDEANAVNIQAATRTPTSITVSWEVSDVNCDVFGYTIRVTELISQDVEVYYAHGGDTDRVVADGLQPDTTYQVTVAGLQIDRQLPEVGFVNVSTGCPEGYETSPEGSCYYFFSEGRTYDVARRSCLGDPEGDLAIVDNEDELEYLMDRISNLKSSESWWIGYFDISVEGVWKWVNCQASDSWQITLWAPDEPDNGVEDCGALSPNGTISDNVCDVFLPYICEITQKGFSRDEANVKNVAAIPVSSRTTNVTWDISDVNCDVIGYNVYYYSQSSGETFVSTVYGGGVNGVILEELEVGVIYDISVAALQTDRELAEVGPVTVCPYYYTTRQLGSCYYFSNGMTSYQSARGSCLSDPEGDLVIINDEEELEFLLAMTSEDGNEETRWIGYFDRAMEGEWTWADCQTSSPWQEALWALGEPTGTDEDCGALEKSGQLSDYVCDRGFRYICELSPKGFSRDDANAVNVQAATRTPTSITVSWKVSDVNCDVFGYTIRVTELISQDVEVYYAHGGDTDRVVADGLQPDTTYQVTVAGLQIDRQLPEVGFVNVSTGCPEGYETSPEGSCYYFFSEGRTYDVARRSCLGDPEGDLAIVDNEDELEYLMDRISNLKSSESWWIGYFDLSVEGVWKWVNCQASDSWQITLWAPDEPDNGVEDCGALSPNGTISDNVCDVFLPYICEITQKGFSRDEANVKNVAAIPVSSRTTNVTWDISDVNCDVIGYNVYYYSQSSGETFVSTVYGGGVNGVILEELEVGVIYDISVAALQTDRELAEVGPVTVCPYYYTTRQPGSCYYFSNGMTSYQSARGSCLSDPEGDLVIINDEEELEFLLAMTSEDGNEESRWIGYFDRAMEGEWTWADCQTSSPWQEALWALGEPTGTDEDCGALEKSGQLSDYVCDRGFRYICELSPKGFSRDDANAVNVQATTRTPTSITVSWEVSDVNCDVFGYTIRVTELISQDVEVYYAHGGNTDRVIADGLQPDTTYQVTVAGLQIDRQLPEVGFVNVSTGCPEGYEISPEGSCYFFFAYGRTYDVARRSCLGDPEGDLAIVDNQNELNYLMNRVSTLDNSESWWIGYFDVSEEGAWKWVDCQASDSWQMTLWAPGEPDNGAEDCGALSPNGTISDDVCDVFLPYICEITDKGFSRNEANVQNVGATPITLTRTVVTWQVSDVNCDVIGYNIYYYSQTSGKRSVSTVYGGNVNRFTLDNLEVGVIYDISVAALQTDRELPEVGPVAVCPFLYQTRKSGSCYYFSNGMTSYESARASCLSDPEGDLVVISDQEELDYLLEMTSQDGAEEFRWIGYFDRATEGQWTWADCQTSNTWQEGLWAPDEPTGTDEDCGALERSGKLSDYVCDRGFRYICEILPKGFSRDDANAVNVQAAPRTPTSITVSWEVSEVNCDVFGYTIRVTDLVSQNVEVYYAHGGDTSSIVADGLRSQINYQVTVAGLQIDRQLPEVGFVNMSTGCPDGYETSPGGGCYYFFTDGRTYDVARRSCLGDPEGDLVIVDNQDELEYLMDRVSTLANSESWWIGYFDVSEEGAWKWVDCQASDSWQMTLWAPDEPDNGAEDCGALSLNGTISDNVCDVFLPYICEITDKGFSRNEANVQNVGATPITLTRTGVTWQVSDVSCDVIGYNIYYYSQTSGKRSVSTVYGGNVDRFTLDNLEVGVIYDISVTALQMDRELPEVGPVAVCPFLYQTRKSGSCYYFSNGMTSYESARASCLSYSEGELVVISDQEELDYLLEMTSQDGAEEFRWIGYFDRATEGQWTWADCQTSNTWQEGLWAPDEPTGTDEDCGALERSGKLSDYVCDRGFRYICEIFPKGFSRDDANAVNVQAASRTPSSITVSWEVSEVNCDVFGYTIRVTDFVSKDVKVYYAHGGDTSSIVADTLRSQTTYQVTVAGLQIDRQLPEVGFVNISTGCPDGYETSPGGGCYYFFADGRTYDVARRSCLGDPEGDLVIIDSQDELDYLMNRTSILKSDESWWIGYFDVSVEGSWKWVDCQASSTWQIGLWAPGEPGNGVEDCGALSSNGTISDDVCDVFLPFICEISEKAFSRDEANIKNVAAIPVSSRTTNVTWDVSDYNCDVIGYNVYYYSQSSGIRSISTVYGGGVSGIILEDLEVGGIYDISVAALQTDRELSEVGPVTVCPYLYETRQSGSCYYFSNGMTSYQGARGSCLSDPESDLVIISDQEELDYLLAMTSEDGDEESRWIGYFDRATEGQWTWADCQTSNTWQEYLWATDEPTGTDEDCGALERSGELSDYVCDRGFRYICEISPKGFSRDDANAVNVQAASRTLTSITVSWEVSEVNCDVFGYTIRVTDVVTQDVEVYYAHGGDTRSLVADGLRSQTTYQVTVAGLQIDRQLPEVGFVNISTGCPDGYETSPEGGCYYFFADGRTYDVARRSCLGDPDGDLVIIDSQDELDYLMNRTSILKNDESWWIGYFDVSVEGSWKWVDCQASNSWQMTLWAPGEPDNGVEDCGALSPNGTISDDVCDVFMPFICEISEKAFSRDEANVKNVAAIPVSSRTTNVTWDVSDYNCDVIGYNVYYYSQSSGKRFVSTVYGGDVSGVILKELEVGVIYDISVAALQTDQELSEVGPVTVCPYLYETRQSGSCYYFSNGLTSYQGARGSCLSDPDGDLVIISDQEELDYLLARTSGDGDEESRWIGYFDRATEGQWTWADCQTSNTWQGALWATDEPTGTDEDCGALDRSGKLSDYVCDRGFRYICEISPKGFSRDDANALNVQAATRTPTSITVSWEVSEVNCDVFGYTIRVTDGVSKDVEVYYAHGGDTSSLVADGLRSQTTYQVTVAGLQIDRQLPEVGFVNISTGCLDGYETSPGGGCYYFFTDGRTYDVARRSCLGDPDGDLVIVDNQYELDYLMSRMSTLKNDESWWIGYFDVSVEGSWKWVDCQASDSWQMTLWAPGEPDNGVEDCGALSPNGTISDDVCDVFLPFICEISEKAFSRDEANVKNVAAIPVSSRTTNVTWDVSHVNCDVIGYNVYYYSQSSGKRSISTVYGGDVNGVILEDLEVGVIYDISVAALQTDRELPEVGPVTVCPYLYETRQSGSCYYFSNGLTSYQGARGSCLSDPDSDLVIISDQEELDYLLARTSGDGDEESRWIGYFDRAAEGQWTWADCQTSNTWQEALWAADEPTGTDEDCGALERSGKLSDYVCDRGFRYICEISPKGFSRDDANAVNVQAASRTPTSITVSWEVSEVNCDVFGYTIRVTDVVSNDVEVYYAHGGDTSSLVADGLRSQTTYQVTVAGLQIDRQLPEVGFVNISTGCPDGYETFPGGGCYYFFADGRTFDVARRSCLGDPDGDLVIINNQDELDYLMNRTSTLKNDRSWWIGYFDISVEGSWKWTDCQASSSWQMTLWAPGEPDNGVEDCGALSPNGTISDDVCDVFLPFICEISEKAFSRDEANVKNVAAIPASSRTTNVTWDVSDVNCDVIGYNVYYYSQSSGKRSISTVYGGAVSGVILEDLEVGVIYDISVAALQTDRELSEVGPVTVCPYLYETGRSGSCYYFSNGITSYQGARGSCLSDPDSDLAIISDQEELDYLLARTSGDGDEESRWIGYFDRATEGQWTWADCKTSNEWQEALWAPGEPTGVDEDCGALERNGKLSDYVCDQGFGYICEISPKGFSRDDANAAKVQAASRTPTSITVSWEISEVNCDVFGYTIRVSDIGSENVEIYYANGGDTNSLVADGLESETTYQVTVAGLQIDRQLPEVGFVNVSTGCADGYDTSPGGGCYYFFADGRTYDVARRSCLVDSGGDLVIVDNQEELGYLMDKMSELNNGDKWWIGYFDVSVEGVWKWVDCQASDSWQMTLWAPGEPDNGIEDCGALSPNGTISDDVCDVFLPYICEITDKGFSRDEANVKNVAALPASSRTTNVTWDVSDYNCDVIGYNIYYYSQSSGKRSVSTVYGGDVSGVILEDLEVGVIYDISVAALQTDRELSEVGPATVCPYLYEARQSGSCYYFSNGMTSYQGARGSCLSDPDSDLVIISDQEELDYLLARTSGDSDEESRWIGYFDRATEGQWTWADCQASNPWQEALWAPGEPTGTDEDCGALDRSGQLSDYVCDRGFRYICEISPKGFSRDEANAAHVMVASISTTEVNVTWTTSDVNCDVFGYIIRLTRISTGEVDHFYANGGDTSFYVVDGLMPGHNYQVTVAGLQIDRELPEVGFVNVTVDCPRYYEASPVDGCYYFSTEKDGFSSWRADCQYLEDGDLVIIDNQRELDFITEKAAELNVNNIWLGYFDIAVEGDWQWATCVAPNPWQESLWGPGEPGDGDCAILSSSTGLVEAVICDQYFPGVCELIPKDFTIDDANVRNVMASATSYSEILVEWDVSPVGCDVFGYRIFYFRSTDASSEESVSVYGGDINSYELQGLLPTTSYTIYVAGLHIYRELDQVGPAQATTLPVCDPEFISQNDTFTSPGYPFPYPDNAMCEWFLSAPQNNFLLLQIREFQTERSYDFLTIGEGTVVNLDKVLYRLSGTLGVDNDIPSKILSPSENLWAVFQSSGVATNLSGFSIDIFIVTQGPSEPVREVTEVVGETSGVISSPNWEEGLNYPNNRDIVWLITVAKGYQVDFSILNVMLEENVDFLRVGDGSEVGVNTLEELTGLVEEPLKTNTVSNQAWVWFTTDESINDRGFSLEWSEDRTIGEPCPSEELTDPSGIIQSPEYPNEYPHNQDCSWFITLPSEQNKVLLQFESFSIEYSFDYLYVGEGLVINEDIVAILTGDAVPDDILASSNQMWLRFTSDDAISGTGFNILYSSVSAVTEPPQTPPLETRQQSSVIMVVQNQGEEWFAENEELLAEAIAQALTQYCSNNPGECLEDAASTKAKRRLLATEYQASDVDFVQVTESGNNLKVYTWVWEPVAPGTGVPQDVLKSALDEEADTVLDVMNDPNLEYSTEIPKVDTTKGLEAWSIALIIAATVLLLIAIVGYFEFKSRRKENDYLMNSNEPDDAPSGPRSDTGSDFRDAEEGNATSEKSEVRVQPSETGATLQDAPQSEDSVGVKEDIPLQDNTQTKDASSDTRNDITHVEEKKEISKPDPAVETHQSGATLQNASQGDAIVGTKDDIALTNNMKESDDVGLVNKAFENETDENTQL